MKTFPAKSIFLLITVLIVFSCLIPDKYDLTADSGKQISLKIFKASSGKIKLKSENFRIRRYIVKYTPQLLKKFRHQELHTAVIPQFIKHAPWSKGSFF
ncbi:MAG: hypothetical protein JW864_07780 [Spirochaetes bacterium]|nr:hypothetical protein [Spirochaetota bacterium]